jgi:hypothetical protein
MKATFVGKPTNIRRPRAWDNNSGSSDMVDIELDMDGAVEGGNTAAKPAHFRGTFQIKQLVADKLTFGSSFTITIDDGITHAVLEPRKPEPKIKVELDPRDLIPMIQGITATDLFETPMSMPSTTSMAFNAGED